MNSYVIICLFHSVPAVNSTFIFVSLLRSVEQIWLLAGGHHPRRHSFLITVQSSEESYRHGGWTAESRWGALFKQRSTILPNLMETPSPAHPSAAHVFTWGYLLLNVRHSAARRARWKWVGGENGTQNGKIRPLIVSEKQISFTWLLAQLTVVLEWESRFCGSKRKPANSENEEVNVIMEAMVCRILKVFNHDEKWLIFELTTHTWVCHIKQHEMCLKGFIWVSVDSLPAHRPTRSPVTLPLVQMFRPPLLLWQTLSNRAKLKLIQQKGFMALCVGPTIWLWLWLTVHYLLVVAKKILFNFLQSLIVVFQITSRGLG